MSNKEVKVGQVWVGKFTGYEYTVLDVDDGVATLRWDEGLERIAPESVDDILNSGDYQLKIDTSDTEEFIREMSESSPLMKKLFGREDCPQETTILRDHFAGLAMNRLVSEWPDGMKDEMAKQAYRVADAMLNARGE